MSALIDRQEEHKKLDRSQRKVVALAFITSLVLWKIVGYFAVYLYGIIIWFPSLFLAMMVDLVAELLLYPFFGEGMYSIGVFTDPALLFVIFASLQNAIMTRWYLQRGNKSAFVFHAYWLIAVFFIFVAVVASLFVLLAYGFGALFDTFLSPFWEI